MKIITKAAPVEKPQILRAMPMMAAPIVSNTEPVSRLTKQKIQINNRGDITSQSDKPLQLGRQGENEVTAIDITVEGIKDFTQYECFLTFYQQGSFIAKLPVNANKCIINDVVTANSGEYDIIYHIQDKTANEGNLAKREIFASAPFKGIVEASDITAELLNTAEEGIAVVGQLIKKPALNMAMQISTEYDTVNVVTQEGHDIPILGYEADELITPIKVINTTPISGENFLLFKGNNGSIIAKKVPQAGMWVPTEITKVPGNYSITAVVRKGAQIVVMKAVDLVVVQNGLTVNEQLLLEKQRKQLKTSEGTKLATAKSTPDPYQLSFTGEEIDGMTLGVDQRVSMRFLEDSDRDKSFWKDFSPGCVLNQEGDWNAYGDFVIGNTQIFTQKTQGNTQQLYYHDQLLATRVNAEPWQWEATPTIIRITEREPIIHVAHELVEVLPTKKTINLTWKHEDIEPQIAMRNIYDEFGRFGQVVSGEKLNRALDKMANQVDTKIDGAITGAITKGY